jgi:hypothetical protein
MACDKTVDPELASTIRWRCASFSFRSIRSAKCCQYISPRLAREGWRRTWQGLDILCWQMRKQLCKDPNSVLSQWIQYIRYLYQRKGRIIVRLEKLRECIWAFENIQRVR